MRGQVAAAGAQLERRRQRPLDMGLEQLQDPSRLVGVLVGRCEQVEPAGELAVHARGRVGHRGSLLAQTHVSVHSQR